MVSSFALKRIVTTTTTTATRRTMSTNAMIAKLVNASDTSLAECGKRLRNDGGLVSFPTETVYGLGCNALDQDAIPKIFQAKERPHTDPLIVHVLDAKELWDSSNDDCILRLLCKNFWPGPLTLVARAKSHVPELLMAKTGYVACRSPQHDVARSLLQHAGVPIAAPSANKFGHVSPTSAQHVLEDLGTEDVWIVEATTSSSTTSCCNVGVESTVAKYDEQEHSLTVLRQGAVSVKELRDCLSNTRCRVFAKSLATKEHVANVAPGQTIKHYAPRIPSFLIKTTTTTTNNNSSNNNNHVVSVPAVEDDSFTSLLKNVVVIDFGGALSPWEPYSLAYRDLSASGNAKEAAACVFECLRWSETIEGASKVYFPEINVDSDDDGLLAAIKDRLTRAASGVSIDALSLK